MRPRRWWARISGRSGPQGIFWSVCIAESVLAVMGVLLFRRGCWKTTQLAADVG